MQTRQSTFANWARDSRLSIVSDTCRFRERPFVSAEIYKQGRKADFEQRLIADLEDAAERFLEGDRAYWENRRGV
jgi:hypothetical protein